VPLDEALSRVVIDFSGRPGLVWEVPFTRALIGRFDVDERGMILGADGERLLIGWMGLPDTTCPSARDGWAHCLTLPRVLTIEDGQLRQRQFVFAALDGFLPFGSTLRGDAGFFALLV